LLLGVLMRRICTDQELRHFLADGKPHSIIEIKDHFSISEAVVFREMKRIKALPSINKTGCFVLLGNRRFDQNGFFRTENKVFFSGGDLSNALIALVSKSHSGMKTKELEKKVGINSVVQIFNLVKKGRLCRQKVDGKYYYFSSDREIGKRQLEVREREFRKFDYNLLLKEIEDIPLELIIKILVTFIQHPDFSSKSLTLSLVRRGEKIGTRMVECVFRKYGLCKKNF